MSKQTLHTNLVGRKVTWNQHAEHIHGLGPNIGRGIVGVEAWVDRKPSEAEGEIVSAYLTDGVPRFQVRLTKSPLFGEIITLTAEWFKVIE